MDTSILDLPLDESPDPDEFVRAAIEWHFSAETGSPFWLERAKSLDFNPLSDIKGISDLTLFPNVANELRDCRARDLIPMGYGSKPPVVGVFESGGTTGAPKRIVLLQDWFHRVQQRMDARLDELGVARGTDWLVMAPSGPHGGTEVLGRTVAGRGGIKFAIDLDPRWAKPLVANNRVDEADAYVSHLVQQAAFILRTQESTVLMTTPPILERLASNDELAGLIREKIKTIVWGGASMAPKTLQMLRDEAFPDAKIIGFYGNTMFLDSIYQRTESLETGIPVFDPPSPWVTFSVLDPETNQRVALGELGQVVSSHVTRSFFLPNNLERDMAVREAALDGRAGDSLSSVRPVESFDEVAVVEGLY